MANSNFNLSTLNGTNGFKLNSLFSANLGISVGSAGDINGDGFDDLIIDSLGNFSYVVFGSRSGFSSDITIGPVTNGFAIIGIPTNNYLGDVVSRAGDINGDGIDDLIIGAPNVSPNGINASGQSYVVFGSRSGFGTNSGFGTKFNLSTINGINGFRLNGIAANDRSGTSVSGAGDINGDSIDDLIIGSAGQSYVVFGSRNSFSSNFNLSTLDGTNGFKINGFAAGDLSIAGDINGDGIDDLMIGAPNADPNGTDSGQSYVVFGSRSGFSSNLNLSTLNGLNGFVVNGIATNNFSGSSVSNAGDINGDGIDDLIIGAPGANPIGFSASGQSYVIFGSRSGFSASLNLSTLNGTNGFKINGIAAGDSSGRSVSNAGDINGDGIDDLIIGSSQSDINGTSSGQSYVLFGSRSGFSSSIDLSTINGTNGFKINGIVADDNSGRSVSSAGDINGDGIDDLIIGAFGANTDVSRSGQSYVVYGNAAPELDLNGTNNLISGFRINGIAAGDNACWSISNAGDINGDGIDDLMIGAPNADPNGTDSGQSYVVFGSRSGFSANFNLSTLNGTNGFKINGITAGDNSGRSLSSAGDINGDGIDDLIIGAPNADPNNLSSSGQSYVVFGRRSGFSTTLNLINLSGNNGFKINGIAANDIAGTSVSSAGDINGDGIDDLIIGAPNADPNNLSSSGQSYVVFGSRLSTIPSLNLSTLNLSILNGITGFRINGITAGDQSGTSVSSAGDINGDGIDDLIIGANGADLSGFSSGQSYVVFGRTGIGASGTLELSTLNGSNGFIVNGINAADNSGKSVSSAGDINGDGFDDLMIGAFGADPNSLGNSGQSYVVFGHRTFSANFNLSTLNGSNGFKINGIAAGDYSGTSVSRAGDINGDGIDDLIIGAYGSDLNGNYSGQSYVVFGCSTFSANFNLSTLNGNNGFKINGIAAYDYSGKSVSRAGDINGDGFDDLMIGAPDASTNGISSSGQSYVIFGRAGIGSSGTLELSQLSGSITDGIDFSTTFTGTPTAVVDTDLTIVDRNSPNITGAKITITNRLDGAAENLSAPITSIPISYSNGVLTLRGTGTFAQYQQILRSITYNNTAATPNLNARKITFEIDDGASNSNTSSLATTTLNMFAKTIIEQAGGFDLAVGNNQYIAIDKATNAVTSILFNGNLVSPTTFAGWSVVGAERVGDTPTGEIEYMWKDNNSGQFWYSTNTTTGGYVAGAALIAKEADFGQDFNNDGILPIELFGAVNLAINSSNQYIAIDKATSTVTSILFNGNPVTPTTFTGWSVIGAERVGDIPTGAIEYMWKDNNSGQFWYSTNTTTGGYVAGAALLAKEVDFAQDFNGDRVIGLVSIETAGTTTLAINNSGNYIANNGGVDVGILYANAPLSPNTFPGWSVIGAEIVGAEVKAMWKNGSQYWYSTNTNNGIGVTDTTPYEFTFKQDFDNDTFIAQVGTAGNDTFAGTAGKDAFVFKGNPLLSLLNAIGLDTVNNFTPGGQDRLFLSKGNFTALATTVGNPLVTGDFATVTTDAATALGNSIVYNSANGKLFYDANGAAAGFGAGGQFAQLANGLSLSVNSFQAIA
jgi:FG-GAP repeat